MHPIFGASRKMPAHALCDSCGAVHDGDDDYDTNIQIAELNALNATFAVIRWKKWCGFYADLEHEHHSVYTITTNGLVGDDRT
jgi:hypothetical protein